MNEQLAPSPVEARVQEAGALQVVKDIWQMLAADIDAAQDASMNAGPEDLVAE